MSFHQALDYQCSCGAIKVTIKSAPLVRLFCHCTICQRVANKDYADDIITLARDVCVENPAAIIYQKHTSFFAIDRGTCKHCHTMVISYSAVLPFVKLAITPTWLYSQKNKLPDASAHLFYDNKKSPIHDALPKYNGYLLSQFNTVKYILYSIIKRFWGR